MTREEKTMPSFAVGDRVKVRPHQYCGQDCRMVKGMEGVVVVVRSNVQDIGVQWVPTTPSQRDWYNRESHSLDGAIASLPNGERYSVGGWWMASSCLELVVVSTIAIPIAEEVGDEEEYLICDHCDNEVSRTEEVGREEWCETCVDGDAGVCEECEDLVISEDLEYCESHGTRYCLSCIDRHHESCREEEESNGDIIHPYSYNPSPFILHGDGPRYFGVELEIDGGGCSEENASALLTLSKDETLFYIKPDGSLHDGLEIVTHPCSLAFHQNTFPWHEITRKAKRLGYSSHDTTTCGLHVHVSRASLGFDATQQDMTLSKLIILFWAHWENLVKFSRRTPGALAQWANLNYEEKHGSVEEAVLGPHADAKNRGKYAAINTEHRNTLEIRIFRGTLRVETILACIELVDLLCTLAQEWSIGECVKSTWEEVIARVGDRVNLQDYLATHDGGN